VGRVSGLRREGPALNDFIQEVLVPSAARLDTDFELLKAAWDEFVARGLHRFEGRWLFEGSGVLAEFSGAFGFLALQQQVAGSPEVSAGVAFGHLRNPSGPAPLWQNGKVSGEVPWITGAGIFERALLGFRLGDGSEARAWVDATDRPEFRHSEPMSLIALFSTRTVRVEVRGLSVPEADFVSHEPLGTMAAGDARGALGQVPLLLGNCRASVRLIEKSGRGDVEKVRSALAQLEESVAAARASGDALTGRTLRARAGRLSVQLARLACLSCGGASLLARHPAERVYREALVFNLMAQTDQIVADAFAESEL
jgi:hypothetical protein